MKIDKDIIKSKINKLVKTGFFSIFASNVLSKIIVFLGGVVLVRILSKDDYGIYTYVINALSILCLFGDFGATNALLQFLSEEIDNKKRKRAYIRYAIKVSFLGILISSLLVIFSPFFYPFTIDKAKEILPVMFLIPMLNSMIQMVQTILRANLENNKYAFLQMLNTFLHYAFIIPLALAFSLVGAIISQYFYLSVTLIVAIIISYKIIDIFGERNTLSQKEKTSFLKLSLATQANSTIDAFLLMIDTFLIGIMIALPEQIASYKVASTIPQALLFIPTCVIVYILPYFSRKYKDIGWLKENYNKLIKYGFIFYGILTVILFIFAELIIKILFGSNYESSVLCFRILIIGFFVSATFKIPTNNVIYIMRKVKINLIVTISTGILNFILNITFIKNFGIVGAAITTTSLIILNAIFTRICIFKIFKKKLKIKEIE